jgi:hypothetical protein
MEELLRVATNSGLGDYQLGETRGIRSPVESLRSGVGGRETPMPSTTTPPETAGNIDVAYQLTSPLESCLPPTKLQQPRPRPPGELTPQSSISLLDSSHPVTQLESSNLATQSPPYPEVVTTFHMSPKTTTLVGDDTIYHTVCASIINSSIPDYRGLTHPYFSPAQDEQPGTPDTSSRIVVSAEYQSRD